MYDLASAGEFNMTEQQVRAIASEAAREAVLDTLLRLGVSAENPLEMQRDMQHLREWRVSSQELKKKGMLTLIGIFCTGLAGLIVLGLRQWWSQ